VKGCSTIRIERACHVCLQQNCVLCKDKMSCVGGKPMMVVKKNHSCGFSLMLEVSCIEP